MQILFLFLIIIIFTIGFSLIINNRVSIIYFFLVLVIFQNIIAILFCKDIPPLFNTIFSTIKELILYIGLIFVFIKKCKIKFIKSECGNILCLLILFIALVKNFFVTSAGIASSILSLRYLLVPILCIYVGRNLQISQEKYKKLLKNLVKFSLLLAILGIIELTLLGDTFWTNIDYSLYAVKMKGNAISNLFGGVTINFYTWDFGGIPIRRLVSITADPLATAYLIYLGALILITGSISITNKNNRLTIKVVTLFILFTAAVMSLSKAVFVMIALTILLVAYFYRWLPKSILRTATVGFVVLFTLILKSYFENSIQPTSSLNHISGLINGFSSANILGNGLGTAGASVSMLTGVQNNIAESYIGVIFSQIGFVGGIAFLTFIVLQIKKLLTLYSEFNENSIVLAIICAIGPLVCAIFSESAISIMGTGIYFIIVGIAEQKKLYHS